MKDHKQDIIRRLKDKNTRGYDFNLHEDENNIIASLSNNALCKLVRLDKTDDDFILGYTLVKDKNKRITRTFQSEVNIDGRSVAIIVRDLVTKRIINKYSFPTPTDHSHKKRFSTLEQCIEDFRCKQGGQLQCEANRTCKNQYASLICCLKNGFCVSVHLIFRPNSLRCQIISNVPAFEGLVLSR